MTLLLVVLYLIVGLCAAMFAFVQMAAREESEPDILLGLGLVVVCLIVMMVWPVFAVFGGLALAGRQAAHMVWRKAVALPDAEPPDAP